MTLATMMSESVEILRRTVTGEDSSGVEEVTWSTIATVPAFVGRPGPSTPSTENVGGMDKVIADYGFMLPAGTDVEAYDRLVHDGKTFEVVGLPSAGVKPGAGEQFTSVIGKWIEG